MAVVSVRIPEKVKIPWKILAMAMRIESEDLKPRLESLVEEYTAFHEEIAKLQKDLDTLLEKFPALIKEAETLKEDTTPLWDDSYNLCGNPECTGDCRVCQEGEEDYEDDYEEKYCRRGRR